MVAETARFAVGTIFLVSVTAKAQSPRSFVDGLRQYGLLPNALTPLVAAVVIGGEVATALALFAGVATKAALVLATAMLTGFGIAIAITLRGRKTVDCHCFGAAMSTTTRTRDTHVTYSFCRACLLALSYASGSLSIRTPLEYGLALTCGIGAVQLGRWLLLFASISCTHRLD